MIEHPLQDGQPRAASYQLSDLPEVNHSAQYSHDAPQVYEPAHLEVATSKYENEKYSYSTTPASSTTPYPTHAAELTSHAHMQISNEKEVAPTRENKTIWGFQRRVFILACIVGGLIIIGIIVASVVAVVVTRNQEASQSGNQLGNNNGTGSGGDQTGSGNGNSSGNGNGPNRGGGGPGTLLAQTALAVANFTEETGAQAAHHYVFAQSNTGELIASQWDSQNKTWSTVSISRIFAAMGGTNPNLDLNPLNGTPIAAFAYTNPSFQMRVYFLDTSRVIHELINTDPWLRPQGWKPGSLGFSSASTSNTILVAREGSHLTALRPQCGTGSDCRNKFPQMAVIFQNPSNVVVLAKAPGWVPQTIAPAEARTVLGISGLIETPDITDFQWRLNFFQAGMFKEYGSNGGLEGWIDGRSLDRITPPEKAMSSFSFDLRNIMVLTVEGDGTLWARIYTGKAAKWDQDPLPVVSTAGISASAAKFTAAAGSAGKRIYALLEDGVLHEWQFVSGGEGSWQYIGVVPIGF